MDVAQIYAITAAGFFAALLAIRFIVVLRQFLSHYNLLFFKNFLFALLVRRHRLFGPWTRIQVISIILHIITNVVDVTAGTANVKNAGDRAEVLSLINIIPCYFGLHLGFASDLLGLSLRTYRQFHASAGSMFFALGLLHAIIRLATVEDSDLFQASGQLLSFLVRRRSFVYESFDRLTGYMCQTLLFLCILVIPSLRFLRLFLYELFLRSHQILVIAIIYGFWIHTVSGTKFLGLSVITLIAIFSTASVLQLLTLIFKNFSFRRGRTRALVSKNYNAVRITVDVSRELNVRAGQYVNLCLPFVGFRSLL